MQLAGRKSEREMLQYALDYTQSALVACMAAGVLAKPF